MRTLLSGGLLLLFAATGCRTSEVSSGTAGEAGDETRDITDLAVLPVTLPAEIHGDLSAAESERYRNDWPMSAARLVAESVVDETGEAVRAIASESKPDKGHYLEVELTYVDVGDRSVRGENLLDDDREGWSLVKANAYIYNASSGELVAELDLQASSGGLRKVPFENDMASIGDEIGAWLEERS